MKRLIYKKGFTLIELLVVIGIIGVLSAVLYANFGDAREDARNKAIKVEMKEVQLAIELYKAQNGSYPPAQTVCKTTNFHGTIDTALESTCGNNPIIESLVAEFIADLPARADSGNANCDFEYQVDTAGSWYKFTAINCHAGAASAAEGVQLGDEFARCLSTCTPSGFCDPSTAAFYESYAVYSAGGECM